MTTRKIAPLLIGFSLSGNSLAQFSLSLSDSDFASTPVFSNVTTFELSIQSLSSLMAGISYPDPSITNIQYSASGALDTTPSGFSGFGFALNHIFPSSPPITGAEFYALNPGAPSGGTINFQISPTANLLDGLQLSELDELPSAQFGSGVIFHFDGREVGTGRYHPMFLQLKSDGTGLLQNSNNMGGVNPQDGSPDEIDVDFGEEYITNLTFTPSAVTLAVPEPSTSLIALLGLGLLSASRRRASGS